MKTERTLREDSVKGTRVDSPPMHRDVLCSSRSRADQVSMFKRQNYNIYYITDLNIK